MDDSGTLIGFGFIALLVMGGIGAALLDKSGRGAIGFALGFFLGPIGLIIAAIMRGDPTPAPSPALAAATKKCSQCAETVLAEARKCRYCGSDLSDTLPSVSRALNPAVPVGPKWWRCRLCQTEYERGMELCPKCDDSRRDMIGSASV